MMLCKTRHVCLRVAHMKVIWSTNPWLLVRQRRFLHPHTLGQKEIQYHTVVNADTTIDVREIIRSNLKENIIFMTCGMSTELILPNAFLLFCPMHFL